MDIDRLDHLVVTASDVDATCAFYTAVLGMRVIVSADSRRALAFGAQKINLHQLGAEFEPKAARPTAGSADLCFITHTPLPEAMAHVESQGVAIIEGPVERAGALGEMISFYFRDPDGNLIEVASYGSEGQRSGSAP